MFDYTQEQVHILDGISYWYGELHRNQDVLTEERDNLKFSKMLYDHHRYSHAQGIEQRARFALMNLISLGVETGLSEDVVHKAIRMSLPRGAKMYKKLGMPHVKASREQREMVGYHPWGTLQNLVTAHPEIDRVKNREFWDRYIHLESVRAARRKQLQYRAERGTVKAPTPYDDELLEAIAKVYYRFCLSEVLPIRTADIARVYGTQANKNTVQALINRAKKRGC